MNEQKTDINEKKLDYLFYHSQLQSTVNCSYILLWHSMFNVVVVKKKVVGSSSECAECVAVSEQHQGLYLESTKSVNNQWLKILTAVSYSCTVTDGIQSSKFVKVFFCKSVKDGCGLFVYESRDSACTSLIEIKVSLCLWLHFHRDLYICKWLS